MFAKTILATVAAAAVLTSVASASAAPIAGNPDVASQTVFVGDLNLSSQTGARIALRRIGAAATSICGDAPDERLLDRSGPYRACFRATVDKAVASLDSPVVTALRSPQGVGAMASAR